MIKKSVFLLITTVLLCTNVYAKISLNTHYNGISGKLLQNITAIIATNQNELGALSPQKIALFHKTVPQQITNALQQYGYFNAEVISEMHNHNTTWDATYLIDLKAPIKITGVDLQIHGPGKNDQKIIETLHDFPLKSGQILQIEQYNTAKQFLFEAANNYGYITADFTTKSISVDTKKGTAAIVLHFNTGPLYRFGPISYTQNLFDSKFLNRFLNIRPGEVYSTQKLQELQESLLNSNLFQQANIDPHIPKDNSQMDVPIEISLLPRKAKQYNIGAGYGSDTGIRGLFGIELRHLTSTGQSLNGTLRASEKQNNAEIHYLIPGPHPTTDRYDISAIAQTQNLDCGNSKTIQLSTGYITSILDWQQSTKLSLQNERYQLPGQPEEMSTLLIPSIGWSHIQQDNATYPKYGYNININTQVISKYILTLMHCLQMQVDIKYLYTLTDYNYMVLRSSVGYNTIDNLNDLPLSLQYFAGGTQSIRGYGYNDIGPGRVLNTGSMEFRQKIATDWYAAAFYDIGNAGPKFLSDLKTGIGVGIVWRTQIGALELSIARAQHAPGKPTRVQFSMAPEL